MKASLQFLQPPTTSPLCRRMHQASPFHLLLLLKVSKFRSLPATTDVRLWFMYRQKSKKRETKLPSWLASACDCRHCPLCRHVDCMAANWHPLTDRKMAKNIYCCYCFFIRGGISWCGYQSAARKSLSEDELASANCSARIAFFSRLIAIQCWCCN